MSLGRRKGRKKTVSDPDGFSAVGSLQSTDPKSTGLYEEDVEDQKWDVPQRLKPTLTRIGTLVGLTFVALFWNGIVSVFVWHAVADLKGNFI